MSDHPSSIAEMRRNYTRAGLSETDLAPEPIAQFRHWLSEEIEANAGAPFEPNAMTLATVNAEGYPSTRTVLLKAIDDDGLVFFTNTTSSKAQQIKANPHVAMTFCWPNLERQINVTGQAEPVAFDRAAAYFRQRPRDNQLGAAVSDQSQIVASRQILEDHLAALKDQIGEDGPVPIPETWGGYKVRPITVEFWQGRVGRLHDRLRYHLIDNHWRIERLWP